VSANGNGKVRLVTLEDMDRRTTAYRRTAETIDAIEVDLGGADMLSTQERMIVRHVALIGSMIEDLGARWLAGEGIDPVMVSTLSNAERRLYEAVGLRRRSRNVTPSLDDILREEATP
jgi:hypothetical protein